MARDQRDFDVLNKDGQFKKFFEEYLTKESKIEVAGRTRQSKLWPIIKNILKSLPKNASTKDKYEAIKNYQVRGSEFGYSGGSARRKMGDIIVSNITNSFQDAAKGVNKINIKQLADEIPAYSYKSLQAIFGNSKKDPKKYSGNAKQNIINSKIFVEKLKDIGVVTAQGDVKKARAGRAYLFEPLTEDVKLKLKELKPLRSPKTDYDNLKFRRLVESFSRASEDYKKFGFSKDATALTNTANNLNSAIIEEFTSKPLGLQTGKKPNISLINSAMSKDDVAQLRQFIEDNPKIKNVLSITFDPSGKNGTYFKPRDLDKLSGGQLLKDILVEKDHIFPVKEIEILEKPTRTSMGVLKGGALSETPFNKVLTTGYFNNSLRNKIQNFLNSGAIKEDAVKQINNTLKGLDTTIYHNGEYYGGKITPSIEKQINRLGYDKFDIEKNVIQNIKDQDVAIKDLKKQKFSDSAIVKAVKNSRFALPFVIGAGVVSSLTSTPVEAEEPIKYNDEIGAFVNPQTDDKVSQATLLDWAANNPMPTAAIASAPLLSKTVRKGTGKLLKGLLSTLGTSAAGLTFAGMTVKDNLDEGKNIVDATVDPMVGIELLYPEAVKRFSGKGLQNALGRALSLGRVGTMMTPVGMGITALGLGKMGIEAAMDEREKILGMTEEEKTNYLADQYESFGGVFGEGA